MGSHVLSMYSAWAVSEGFTPPPPPRYMGDQGKGQ